MMNKKSSKTFNWRCCIIECLDTIYAFFVHISFYQIFDSMVSFNYYLNFHLVDLTVNEINLLDQNSIKYALRCACYSKNDKAFCNKRDFFN